MSVVARSDPKGTVITIYGRKPVLEALRDGTLTPLRLFLVKGAQGQTIDAIKTAAQQHGIEVFKRDREEVSRISRNERADQGVALDLHAPLLRTLDVFLEEVRGPAKRATHRVLVLDGITNPHNVGMIMRSAAAFGLSGVVLPRHGSPGLGPKVVKSSAGLVFKVPVLQVGHAAEACEALVRCGFRVVGLDAGADPVLGSTSSSRLAYVLGNETAGVSAEVQAHVQAWERIPLVDGVDSLNVSVAAGIVGYALTQT